MSALDGHSAAQVGDDVGSRPLEILVVEDSPSDAAMIRETMTERLGSVHVRIETTLRAAMDALADATPDCVLLDLGLPDSDGVATLDAVIAGAPDVAVIVLTGLDDDRIGRAAMARGAQDYLIKGKSDDDAIARSVRYSVERKHQQNTYARSLDATVHALSNITELRDPYTAGHQLRVADLAFEIGESLELPTDTVKGIKLAASIHDIGKISVPAEILSNPGVLSDLQMRLVRAHAEAGYQILRGIDFPWPIAEMVRQHHERLDGSGYPMGLTGDQILLEAKIIAVADVVEAARSNRPYRPARGIDRALEIVVAGRGAQFDAAAVDACVSLFRDGGYALPDQ